MMIIIDVNINHQLRVKNAAPINAKEYVRSDRL